MTSRTEKKACAGKVHNEYSTYSCSRSGTYEEAGSWWCASHAPSRVAGRKAKRAAAFQAEWAEREAQRETRKQLIARARAAQSYFVDGGDSTTAQLIGDLLDLIL
jgi:hypothetical protein